MLAVLFAVFFAGQSWAAAVQWSGNGHYYEFVGFELSELNGLTWDEARLAAEARTGYLATITSAEENSFINSLLPARVPDVGLTTAWLGGNQTSRTAWQWATGPEAGEQFFHVRDVVYRVDDMYTNWSTDPNRPSFTTELPYLLMNAQGWYTPGLWDDASATYRSGYIIEYNSSPVPVPATLPLLVSGLGALGFILRRKNR